MNNKVLIIGAMVIGVGLMVFAGLYNHNQPGNYAAGTFHGQTTEDFTVAPDFSLSQLDGEVITLADYRDGKPIILDFWASWCPNCRRDMPKLNRFYEKYKDEVEVIGVNLQENQVTVESFVSSFGIKFPVVLDPFGQVSRQYGVQYTNTHVLIDKDGNIVRVIPGDIRESDVVALIELSS